jgi:RHS repeat-associated protein
MNRIKKKTVCTFLLLQAVLCATAQTQGQNYIRTVTYLNRQGTDSIVSVRYFDGLGRQIRKTEGGLNTQGTYLHSRTDYNGAGRETAEWLPVTGGSEPSFLSDSDFAGLSLSTYNGDTKAFTETEYDALDRKTFLSTPGESWLGKGKHTRYRTNQTGEVRRYDPLNVFVYQYYEAGVLYCTETEDEDGQTVREYRDFLGNRILERRMQGSETFDTYYVYNGLGRLACVLPPMYHGNPGEESLNRYAYLYSYDNRGNITGKKLPGCVDIQYEYDQADRLVRMQDGPLRSAGRSRVYTYDSFDRLTKQSICQGNTVCYDEVRNYYDNYDIPELDECPYRNFLLSASSGNNALGKQTATIQRASSGELLVTVMGYDEYGRVCTVNDHGLDSYASYKTISYSFTGDVTEEKTTELTETGGTVWPKSETTVKNYYYPGTKLPSYSVITVKDPITQRIMADHDTIQHLTYDDLGRVVANNRNGTKSDMTYGYDRLHGWITDIRSGGGFEQHLFREAGSFEPKWNGSITAMMWKTPDSDVTRRYDYCYDGLNRLTDAMYCEVTGQSGSSGSGDPNNPQNIIPETLQTEAFDKYSEYASYDKNSNFTSFQRYGMLNNRTYGQTDDLVFSYNGNQFKWVDDDTEQTLTYNGAFDFDDGADSNVEYTYNANGQLTSDANSGISLIQYDMLGNPKKVTMASGDYIEYVYAPDGTKLKASHYTKRTNNTYSCQNTFYRGNMIYEYGANGYPDKILFPGGYYFYVSADDMMMRDYYVQDYQGNNRMVVHQYMGSDFFGQTTHYYPFGGVIGDISTNQDLLDYKYSGKEFDRTYGLDFYDFHARQYDPKVPRFTGIDQLAEDEPSISPYTYCAGDPVNFIDPTGMDTLRISGYYDSNQNWMWNIDYAPGGSFDVFFVTNPAGKTTSYSFDEDSYISQLSIEEYGDITLNVINLKGENIYGFAVTPGGSPSNALGSNKSPFSGKYELRGNNNARKWKCAGPFVKNENGADRQIRIHYAGYDINNTKAISLVKNWTQGCSVVSSSYEKRDGNIYFSPKDSFGLYKEIQTRLGGIQTSYTINNNIRYGFIFNGAIKKKMQYMY